MDGGEDFVGFANEVQTILTAAGSIKQQQIRIGILHCFKVIRVLDWCLNEWTAVKCRHAVKNWSVRSRIAKKPRAVAWLWLLAAVSNVRAGLRDLHVPSGEAIKLTTQPADQAARI